MPFVLADTNILLRSADPVHSMYRKAIDAVELLRLRGDTPCLVPQCLVEFLAVATRPLSANGLGLEQARVKTEIARLKSLFPVFEELPILFPEWERLVDTYGAIGKQNHDARLVAAMNIYGITTLLTFNKSDFIRYSELTVWEPDDLLVG